MEGTEEGNDAFDARAFEQRVTSLIQKVGNEKEGLNQNLLMLSSVLKDDLDEHGSILSKILVSCAASLSVETPVFATLSALLGTHSSSFVERIITDTMEKLKGALTKAFGPRVFLSVRLLLRFLGELVNASAWRASDCVSFYRSLLVPILGCNGKLSARVVRRCDAIVYAIIATFPWCGESLSTADSAGMEDLFSDIDIYFERRDSINNTVLSMFSGRVVDPMERTFEVVKRFRPSRREREDSGPKVSGVILAPWRDLADELSSLGAVEFSVFDEMMSFDGSLASNVLCSIPEVFVGSIEEFHMDRFVIENFVEDALIAFRKSITDCLGALDRVSAHDVDRKITTEIIFRGFFRVPRPFFKPVFFQRLLSEIGRARGLSATYDAFAKLYERVGDLDVEGFDRFVDLFGLLLSDCDGKWQWEMFGDVSKLENTSRGKLFLQESLVHFSWVSYVDHIAEIAPKEIVESIAIPQKKIVSPFSSSQIPEERDIHDAIRDAISSRRSARALLEMLEESSDQELFCRVFCASAFVVGGTSFGMMLKLLEAYHEVFIKVVQTTKDGMQVVLRAMRDVLRDSPQMELIAADKLVTMRIVDPTAIISHIIGPELVDISSFRRFEVVRMIVEKVVQRTQTVKQMMLEDTERTEERKAKAIASVMRQEKEAFVVLFQRLSELLQNLTAEMDDDFGRWVVLGHIHEMGRKYRTEIGPFLPTLGAIAFSNDDGGVLSEIEKLD